MTTLLGMRLRKSNPEAIIKSAIIFRRAGADVSISDVEALYLSGGHIEEITKAFLEAKKLNIDY